MEATRNQCDFAAIVVRRNKERLNAEYDAKEKETHKFFYWIMKLFIYRMETLWIAKKHIQIELYATLIKDGRVYVEYENVDYYYSTSQVSADDFLSIMEDVQHIFNSLPHYHARYHCNKDSGTAHFTAFMDI